MQADKFVKEMEMAKTAVSDDLAKTNAKLKEEKDKQDDAQGELERLGKHEEALEEKIKKAKAALPEIVANGESKLDEAKMALSQLQSGEQSSDNADDNAAF